MQEIERAIIISKEKIESAGCSDEELEYRKVCLQALQEKLDRQENKALSVEELILLLDENERYPIWYQYANYEPMPEIMTAVATNRHTGEHKIYFIDENFAVVSEHTKFYKHKPNERVM